MNAEIVKKAVELAENELKEQKIQEAKKIVLKTLEKLSKIEKDIRKLQEEKRLLKMDIDDMKEGHLDRIAERQEKDEKAKEASVVVIIKEKVVERVSPWHWPYIIQWKPAYVDTKPVWYTNTGNSAVSNLIADANNYTKLDTHEFVKLDNSIVKCATIGAYTLEDNSVVHLR